MDFLKDLNLDKVRNLAEDAFNQAKPKTELEARVYEVLSHKNWGSSSTTLNEIARDTFDYEKFTVISQLMWEAMENQRPAAWRVVFKGLTLLEHLIKNGSERCVDDARNHGHSLRALHQFNYYEGTIDRGLGVREKSKQLVDLLQDDERIREERSKARKLRDKFGGSRGVAGSGAASGGGGGAYVGYGNDNWNGGSSTGGYGDGGIGATAGASGRYDDGGRYGDSSSGTGTGGGGAYGGRYDDDRSAGVVAPTSTSIAATPTFAAIPDDSKKTSSGVKSKKSKKKKKADGQGEATAAATGTTVDLFSFDTPAPATTVAGASDDFGADEFDAFQSASSATTTTSATAAVDPFAAAMPVTAPTFDAFGGAQQQPAAVGFDAFASAPIPQQQPSPAMGMIMNNKNNMFGMGGATTNQTAPIVGGNTNMMMMMSGIGGGGIGRAGSSHISAATSGGGGSSNPSATFGNQADDDDDEFGDFGSAAPSGTKAASTMPTLASSAGPLSKLISLDGLSKNSKKEDKLNQPVIVNAAAATYIQEQASIQETIKKSTKGSVMSFEGIDGLPKQHAPNSMGMPMVGGLGNSMGGTGFISNPSVMLGSTGSGGADAIGMLDPSVVMPQRVPQTLQQQQAGMMNPQQQQQQMMGGAMNPQQQQQMMAMMQARMNPIQQQQFNAMPPQQKQQILMMMMMQNMQLNNNNNIGSNNMSGGMGGGMNAGGGGGGGMGVAGAGMGMSGMSMNMSGASVGGLGMNMGGGGMNGGAFSQGGVGGPGMMGGQPMGGWR